MGQFTGAPPVHLPQTLWSSSHLNIFLLLIKRHISHCYPHQNKVPHLMVTTKGTKGAKAAKGTKGAKATKGNKGAKSIKGTKVVNPEVPR